MSGYLGGPEGEISSCAVEHLLEVLEVSIQAVQTLIAQEISDVHGTGWALRQAMQTTTKTGTSEPKNRGRLYNARRKASTHCFKLSTYCFKLP